ncbi:RNAse P Rpr2/Rpp21 subunit domain containing protein [Entamoeba marina]
MGKKTIPKNYSQARSQYLLKISDLLIKFHPVTGQHIGLAIRNINHRCVFRLAQRWKRRFCKKCFMPMSYGLMKTKRVGKKLVVKNICNKCGYRRRYYIE